MVKEIVKDVMLLSMKSKPATRNDKQIGMDLKETLAFHQQTCVGLAANMIGELKCIIVLITNEEKILLMYNPQIIKASEPYETEEGCLSLSGVRKTKRFNKIKVAYEDENFKKKIKTYTDFEAQIIQHEIDHCNGILI